MNSQPLNANEHDAIAPPLPWGNGQVSTQYRPYPFHTPNPQSSANARRPYSVCPQWEVKGCKMKKGFPTTSLPGTTYKRGQAVSDLAC